MLTMLFSVSTNAYICQWCSCRDWSFIVWLTKCKCGTEWRTVVVLVWLLLRLKLCKLHMSTVKLHNSLLHSNSVAILAFTYYKHSLCTALFLEFVICCRSIAEWGEHCPRFVSYPAKIFILLILVAHRIHDGDIISISKRQFNCSRNCLLNIF